MRGFHPRDWVSITHTRTIKNENTMPIPQTLQDIYLAVLIRKNPITIEKLVVKEYTGPISKSLMTHTMLYGVILHDINYYILRPSGVKFGNIKPDLELAQRQRQKKEFPVCVEPGCDRLTKYGYKHCFQHITLWICMGCRKRESYYVKTAGCCVKCREKYNE